MAAGEVGEEGKSKANFIQGGTEGVGRMGQGQEGTGANVATS